MNKIEQKEVEKITYNCIKNIKLQAAYEIFEIIEQCRVKEDSRYGWRKHHNDCIDKIVCAIQGKFINKMEIE